jgi:hypothetical protein
MVRMAYKIAKREGIARFWRGIIRTVTTNQHLLLETFRDSRVITLPMKHHKC